jgi:hypothetical protein
MVATFCLRLAFGMLGAVLILDPAPIPPRFFRVQHLSALALLAIAALFLGEGATRGLWAALIAAMLLCFVGSVVWHLDAAPGGRPLNVLAALASLICLAVLDMNAAPVGPDGMPLADDLACAAVLGTAMTAMLMGHSYLIAPAMTMKPLLQLLLALGAALIVRSALACFGLWQWTTVQLSDNLDTETLLWLIARWLLGLVGPAILGWMAWETARIRSTQSATGILYVVVILVFLGELTSVLLTEKTRLIL